MLTTAQFFANAKKAGMTKPASWTPSAGGPLQPYDVIFRAPTRDVLSGHAAATDYSISYPATVFVGLKRGETLTVTLETGAVSFKLREDPESELDGSRMKAVLTTS